MEEILNKLAVIDTVNKSFSLIDQKKFSEDDLHAILLMIALFIAQMVRSYMA